MELVDLYYYRLIPVILCLLCLYVATRKKNSAKIEHQRLSFSNGVVYHAIATVSFLLTKGCICFHGDRGEFRESINLHDYPQFPVQFNPVDCFFECVMPH
jgi:hypothetical protein